MATPTQELARPESVERLAPAVEVSPLQVGIFDLERGRLAEASESTTRLFRSHRSLGEMLEDPSAAQQALRLVRDGIVGGYQAHRRYRLADGSLRDADVWIQALDSTKPHRWALFVAAFDDGDGPDRAACPHPSTFGPMVSGTVDGDCGIEFASADARRLLGVEAAMLAGRRVSDLVHADDRSRVELAAAVSRREGVGVCTHARISPYGDAWQLIHLLVTAIAPAGDRFVYVASPDPRPLSGTEALRLADLEHRLWRIAREIQAAGVAVRSAEQAAMPHRAEFAGLSSRQLEIVQRLARGERVAQIAAAMYLSPRTVRNHLATVFRRFDVHSQSELIAKLRAEP